MPPTSTAISPSNSSDAWPRSPAKSRPRCARRTIARHHHLCLVTAQHPSATSENRADRMHPQTQQLWKGLLALLVLKRVEPAAQEEQGVVEHSERLGLALRPALLGFLVEAALEGGKCRHRRGGHKPRP